ncbi:hypothetical protein FHS96_002606 [Sphingomonas zeicaulis]
MPLRQRRPGARALLGQQLDLLGVAGRQHRQFALVRHALEAAFLEIGFDLPRAAREGIDHRARHTGDLERAACRIASRLRPIAQRLDPGAQRGVEHRAGHPLIVVQRIGAQRAPLAVGALRRIGDESVDMELRLVAPVDVVEEGGRDQIAGADRLLPPAGRGPRLSKIALDPGQCDRRCNPVRADTSRMTSFSPCNFIVPTDRSNDQLPAVVYRRPPAAAEVRSDQLPRIQALAGTERQVLWRGVARGSARLRRWQKTAFH